MAPVVESLIIITVKSSGCTVLQYHLGMVTLIIEGTRMPLCNEHSHIRVHKLHVAVTTPILECKASPLAKNAIRIQYHTCRISSYNKYAIYHT